MAEPLGQGIGAYEARLNPAQATANAWVVGSGGVARGNAVATLNNTMKYNRTDGASLETPSVNYTHHRKCACR